MKCIPTVTSHSDPRPSDTIQVGSLNLKILFSSLMLNALPSSLATHSHFPCARPFLPRDPALKLERLNAALHFSRRRQTDRPTITGQYCTTSVCPLENPIAHTAHVVHGPSQVWTSKGLFSCISLFPSNLIRSHLSFALAFRHRTLPHLTHPRRACARPRAPQYNSVTFLHCEHRSPLPSLCDLSRPVSSFSHVTSRLMYNLHVCKNTLA